MEQQPVSKLRRFRNWLSSISLSLVLALVASSYLASVIAGIFHPLDSDEYRNTQVITWLVLGGMLWWAFYRLLRRLWAWLR